MLRSGGSGRIGDRIGGIGEDEFKDQPRLINIYFSVKKFPY